MLLIDADSVQEEKVIAENVVKGKQIYCIKDSKDYYIYNSGYFHSGDVAEAELEQLIMNLCGETKVYRSSSPKATEKPYKVNPSRYSTILRYLRKETYIDRTKFTCPPTIIFCKNGLYHTDLKTFHSYDLYKHDPYKTTYQLPVNYDPEASPEVWDSFLIDLVGEERTDLIYEVIAYILMPHIKYQKAFILFGPAGSGRTTFIDALIRFLGGKGLCPWIKNIKLQELEERFQLGELRDAMLNYFDDLDKDRIWRSEKFRISVTNRHLSGELKRIQSHATWLNRVKHLFSCNNLPELKKDPGMQFWRRWILIPFNAEFKDKEVMTQDDIDDPMIFERDYHMFDKLTDSKALSGLLNRVIEAWERLTNRDHFDKKWDDVEYVSNLWMININPVKMFVDEKCVLNPNFNVDYEVFYKALNDFRKKKGADSITRTMMTRSLKSLEIPQFKVKRVSVKHNPESSGSSYIGLTIREKGTIALDDELEEMELKKPKSRFPFDEF